MSDGKKSTLPLNEDGGQGYTEVRIHPVGAIVKRVVMRGNYEFAGCQFFDKNGTKILEAGYMTAETKEFVLEDDERLIGVSSKLQPSQYSPRHNDLVFIIGKLE